jgi:nucleoside-diphosphate-sugar epimerase
MTGRSGDDAYLVTGASGFIGGAVCDRLLASGATVHGVSRSVVDRTHAAYRHWTVDLADSDQVDRLFEVVQPRYVLHLASCVTGRREVKWITETMNGNLVSTVHVLVAAERAGASKTVLAGSLEEPPADEPNPVPTSPYAASKWAASGYARMFHALYGLRTAVARIFMVYGPGHMDLRKLVPYVCLTAARGETPQLMSGTRPVDWIYVEDVAEGLIRLLHGGPDDGAYVDIGSGELTTTGEVALRLCAMAGTPVEPAIGAIEDRQMEQVRRADPDATEAVLDWRPGVSLDEGLRRTFEWYRDEQAAGRLRETG